MDHDKEAEQSIRERAYQIWLDEGCPDGRHEEHWRQAKAELVSGTSPPLQPDTDNGEMKEPVAGVNPDDITR